MKHDVCPRCGALRSWTREAADPGCNCLKKYSGAEKQAVDGGTKAEIDQQSTVEQSTVEQSAVEQSTVEHLVDDDAVIDNNPYKDTPLKRGAKWRS